MPDDYTGAQLDATFSAIYNAAEYARANFNPAPDIDALLAAIMLIIKDAPPEPDGLWYVSKAPRLWLWLRDAPGGRILSPKFWRNWRGYITETRKVDGWAAPWGWVDVMKDWNGNEKDAGGWCYMNNVELE